MTALIVFVALGLTILVLFEWRERHRKDESPTAVPTPDPSCCGQHLVCERETLLQTIQQPVYYDDEELDALADIPTEHLTESQAESIREVFHTLQATDITGWVRSLQMRHIALPDDVREEALLIVQEQRQQRATGAH